MKKSKIRNMQSLAGLNISQSGANSHENLFNLQKSQKSDVLNWYDLLKVFAILVMIVDHLGYYLFAGSDFLWMRLVGRFAFPLFLFLVGFNGSRRWRWELFFVALVVQLGTILIWRDTGIGLPFNLNILWVVLLARILLSGFSKVKWCFWSRIALVFFFFVASKTTLGMFIQEQLAQVLDYGLLGFGFTIAGFLIQRGSVFFACIDLSPVGRFWGQRFFPSGMLKGALSDLKFVDYLLGVVLLFFMFGWLYNQNIETFYFPEGWMRGVLLSGYLVLVTLIVVLTSPVDVSSVAELRLFRPLGQPKKGNQLLIFLSHNALWIYGVHMIVLMFLFWENLKAAGW